MCQNQLFTNLLLLLITTITVKGLLHKLSNTSNNLSNRILL